MALTTNDPIADMLTRIRNALIARHDTVTMPASNMKKAIAGILLDEGYIKSVDYIDDGLQGQIKIVLKYAQGKESVIKGLKRISKPGLRVYAKNDEIPRVLGGLGVAIVSTSKGVMSDRSARAAGIGGGQKVQLVALAGFFQRGPAGGRVGGSLGRKGDKDIQIHGVSSLRYTKMV